MSSRPTSSRPVVRIAFVQQYIQTASVPSKKAWARTRALLSTPRCCPRWRGHFLLDWRPGCREKSRLKVEFSRPRQVARWEGPLTPNPLTTSVTNPMTRPVRAAGELHCPPTTALGAARSSSLARARAYALRRLAGARHPRVAASVQNTKKLIVLDEDASRNHHAAGWPMRQPNWE